MKKIIIATVTALFFALSTSAFAAGEVDILIKKLVEKGILTQEEGSQILEETREEAAKQKEETKKEFVKDIVPGWVRNTKLTGDLRLRYEWKNRDKDDERHRGRFRARLGIETQVADEVKVLFGLATGTGDPRSTNQTFGGSNEKKEINIDYATVEYTPKWCINKHAVGTKLIGGKFKNPVFTVSELIWDNDITPEGAAGQFSYTATNQFGLFLNSGVFVLEENAKDTSDPFIWVIQPGFSWNVTDTAQFKYAVSYYGFDNVEGATLKYSEGNNTRIRDKKSGDDVYKYDYDSFAMAAELRVKNPFGLVRYGSLFGEYINNTDPSHNNQAFLVGFSLGDEKVSEARQWQLKGMYRRLERDSVLDILPESDFYAGETDTRGSKTMFIYGLRKNINVVLNYNYAERIHGPSRPEHVLQTDINFKF